MTSEKIINLNKVERPLEALSQEMEEPEPEGDWIFTAEEGAVLRKIIRESEMIFREFLGKPYTEELANNISLATLFVQKRAQLELNRRDFALVPIYENHGFRIEAVSLEV